MRNPCVAARLVGLGFAIRRQQDDPAVGAEHTQRADEILTADRIEHEVDALRPFLEPLGAEVDHLVGTQAAHELGVFTRRGGDHVASERFGDLHGMMSHPAGTAVNQHAAPAPSRPVPTSACQAVSGDCAAAAASSKEMFCGLSARCAAGTAANSA